METRGGATSSKAGKIATVNRYPPESHWEPDYHSIGFLYKMNNADFKTIFEESKKYFNQTNLNIYLYTSNGDQGYMSKTEGIAVVCAK